MKYPDRLKKLIDHFDFGVVAYLPDEEVLIVADEGTGDSLLWEDIEDGFVDYIDWSVYTPKYRTLLGSPDPDDSGMVMLTSLFKDIYPIGSEERIIKDVIEEWKGENVEPKFIIMRGLGQY